MNVRRHTWLLALTLAAGPAPSPQAAMAAGRFQNAPVQCPTGAPSVVPAAPNYCTDLVPTPDLDGVAGTLELGPIATPFGVAVTADGRYRYQLTATISGLPAPSTLGPYTTYVAWATTLSLDSAIKLGEVGNGRTRLPELDYQQFRMLVSAESSADVKERSGRLVLRGTSPSARLLAHRDLILQYTPPRDALATAPFSAPDTTATNIETGTHKIVEPATWQTPPMAPDMVMSPAMRALRPSVSPWVPGAGVDPEKWPFARTRETLHLRSGDTLALVASMVRRKVAGRTFVGYAYNGQIPGPLLVVPQGATLIVHYRNDTDLPSSVHWHGVRLDNRYDGADGVTQDPVPPSGRFTYRVHFPDLGIYWYHVHHREDIAQPLGLYGNILVTPQGRAKGSAPPVNETKVLAIGDLLLDTTGPAPWGADAPTNALMGRFGNVFLVNGEINPIWTVKRGSVVRLYLANVSTARSYNLSLDGAPMKLVASDGGSLVNEKPVLSIVIAPAERYVVDVEFPAAGDVILTNRVLALSHMTGTLYPEVDTFATVRVTDERAAPDYAPRFSRMRTDSLAATQIDRYRKYFDRPVDKELRLTMQLGQLPIVISSMLNGVSVPVDWNDGMGMMNWALTPREITWRLQPTDTVSHTMDLGWRFRRGDVVKVRIFNDATMPHAMAHAIHVHGQRFLVLSYNGLLNADLVWKDTVLIPAGGTVDLLLDLANPGRWLLHCHIAEHMEAGMMATFVVD